jgi:Tol biopolymer transport system component
MRSGQSHIWIMDADGSNQRNLMGNMYNVLDGQQSHPTFGANGRIYFQITYDAYARNVLASMPVTGTPAQVVEHTPQGMSDSDPAAAWNGWTIIVRRKQGNFDAGLVYVDLNGNPLISVNYPGKGFMPAWSRNDQWLAYSASPEGDMPGNIFVSKPHDFWRKQITIGVAAGGGKNPVFIKR